MVLVLSDNPIIRLSLNFILLHRRYQETGNIQALAAKWCQRNKHDIWYVYFVIVLSKLNVYVDVELLNRKRAQGSTNSSLY
jgi:hypothetical protein